MSETFEDSVESIEQETVSTVNINTNMETTTAPCFVNTQPRSGRYKSEPQPGPSQPTMTWSHGTPITHTSQPSHGDQGPHSYAHFADSDKQVIHVMRDDSLKSWNLKFNGDSDVIDFFLRIDDYMRSRDISEQKVVRCFSDFLGGKALDFYRQVRDSVCTLADLQTKFKIFFNPTDGDFVLEKNIREHKQRDGQPLNLYILEIQTMNSRLTIPLSNGSLLEIIKHNLLPAYAHLLAVSQDDSIDNLIALGKRFEAYAGPLTTTSPPNRKNTRSVATVKTDNNRNIITCQKCKKKGHSYRQCRTIPGIVCFQCGTRNVLSSNCPKCRPPQNNTNSKNSTPQE